MGVPTTPSPPTAPSKVPVPAIAHLPDGSDLTIQVNFCKNVRCANFGVPPSLAKGQHRSKVHPDTPGIAYTLKGAGSSKTSKSKLQLECDLCKETPPVKSNEGIVRDIERIAEYAVAPEPVSCPDISCANHGQPFSHARYLNWGKNSQGSQRWKCRACSKTFAEPMRTTLRQRSKRRTSNVLTSEAALAFRPA